ncbi:MAG: hypothetical protein K9K64_02965 [Desulfohalobiaceae bacterium]|nr:hypothetical protein [Desulfohalobiaceae bacterium]
MIKRFQGSDGRRRLIDALCRQQIVCGDKKLALKIADIGKILLYDRGESLIHEGGTDSDLFLIITGAVDIIVNHRVVATRGSGWHV